jgi:hypothetical protein
LDVARARGFHFVRMEAASGEYALPGQRPGGPLLGVAFKILLRRAGRATPRTASPGSFRNWARNETISCVSLLSDKAEQPILVRTRCRVGGVHGRVGTALRGRAAGSISMQAACLRLQRERLGILHASLGRIPAAHVVSRPRRFGAHMLTKARPADSGIAPSVALAFSRCTRQCARCPYPR